MTEQQRPDEDVEGHQRFYQDPEAPEPTEASEDVEGHSRSLADEDPGDDVEGHGNIYK
jgi:hypothetical protein